MKRELCEISAWNEKKQFCKVIGHCYKSGVDGLLITINYENGDNTYSLTHAKTGRSVLTCCFTTIRKAKQIVNMFFTECNWSQATQDEITSDVCIIKQHGCAIDYIIKNRNRR